MNWIRYEVTEAEFKQLNKHNLPITVNGNDLTPNSGIELYSRTNQLNAIYDADLGAIRKLNECNPVFKTMPNRDLILYNDHLLNPQITTIVVNGFYGTGKTSTVCSHLVQGLMDSMNGKNGIPMAYISKPHESLGKTYGHLPGEIEDKTYYEFQSFTQYFERYGQPFLAEKLMALEDKQQTTSKKSSTKKKIEQPMLHLLIFEYLRGRDIDKGWIILDECQNTNRKEMSAFVSRVTDNAKLILLGDSNPTQFDKRDTNSKDNGLTFAEDIFQDKKYAGTVQLQTVNHILRGQRVKDLFNALKNN